MNLKNMLLSCALTLASISATAQLTCPSVSLVKSAQLSNTITSDLLSPFGEYLAYGIIMHEGQAFSVITGAYDSPAEALTEGQELLSNADTPYIKHALDTDICVYYTNTWRVKAIGVVRLNDMDHLQHHNITMALIAQ
jgi:hypothetical protein